MQTQIQQIIQYTEQQITTFQRAECPVIANTFKRIQESLTALERLSKSQPLAPQTIPMYNSTINDITSACRRLTAYGEDFNERIGRYKKFTSEIEMRITQTIYRFRQSNNHI